MTAKKTQVTLAQFKAKAAGVVVFGAQVQDAEWQDALHRARSWQRASEVLPLRHPLAALAAQLARKEQE